MNTPIDMVLHCPACGMQHIDAPQELRFSAYPEHQQNHLSAEKSCEESPVQQRPGVMGCSSGNDCAAGAPAVQSCVASAHDDRKVLLVTSTFWPLSHSQQRQVPKGSEEFGDPRREMTVDELQEFCIALSFNRDDYTEEVIRAVEQRMLAQPLFVQVSPAAAAQPAKLLNMTVTVDPAMSPGTVEFRDKDGKLLGRMGCGWRADK